MGYRRTGRQQRAIDYYVEGKSAAEAGRLAGYKPSTARSAMWKLLGKPEVKQEIAERQAEIAKRAEITAVQMIDQFREDREFARSTENATAAVRASELIAKLAGHLVERHQVDARVASFNLTISGLDPSAMQFRTIEGETA